jgi:hypothetical protein
MTDATASLARLMMPRLFAGFAAVFFAVFFAAFRAGFLAAFFALTDRRAGLATLRFIAFFFAAFFFAGRFFADFLAFLAMFASSSARLRLSCHTIMPIKFCKRGAA